ncbi:hypothetical protein MUN89_18695 [Halobacillus salinarum]|uniref:Uncharacterized protein n=1 Tax=Halobacillus salinarum TaxID=2932257 RepID=A0ABY4EJ49_9BACI|nr:hypothetical protein [Halobacillus salinarum]UOQ43878.1 hypothetical protein MUN89_18695 [Halobacillus salinarum]
MMDNQQIEACIQECESAITHLNHAMTKMGEAGQNEKMQHAVKDLEECIEECRDMLQ